MYALLAILAGFLYCSIRFGGRLPKPLRGRSCQGKHWRVAFPGSSKHQIRGFLSVVVAAFSFNDGEKLKLSPNDLLLDIYRMLYPHRWQADALELEILAEDLLHKHGLRLADIWREDLTLGELFAHAQGLAPCAQPHSNVKDTR